MKKGNTTLKFMTWITLLTVMVSFVWPAGITYGYTEVSRAAYKEPIAEGVETEYLNIQTEDGLLNIYMMKVDLTNPYVRVDSLAGSNDQITSAKAVSKLAREAGAIGAINGDFFQMGENAPIGITVKSGSLVTSPVMRNDMYGFGLTKDNKPVFTVFNFQGWVKSPAGTTFQLSGINKPTYLADKGVRSDQDKLHMYTPKWGSKSRGPVSGLTGMVEMVVENNLVKEIRVDKPAVTIPANGYVLAGHGYAGQYLTGNFKAGNPVEVTYKVSPETDNLMAAIGGQALLVHEGKRHWFTQNITGKRARTALGASQDGKTLYFVVVQGENGSRGMTQEELADFMVSVGAWTAVNLDGGGSSTMVARKLGDTTLSVLNTPVYNSERAVPVGLGIFSNAPQGSLAGIKISGPQLLLVGTKKAYTAKGYDIHYNPYALSQADLNWSISPNRGYFDGNVFNAVYSGYAVIKATSGNVEKEYPVTVLGSSDIAKLEVTPPAIAVNPGESVDITVKVTTKQGQVFTLNPNEYDVQVNGEIGSVTGGKFTAANAPAVGELQVKIDSTVANVKVSLGSKEKPLYDFETPRNLKFRGYPMGQTLGGFRLTNVNEPTYRGNGSARLEYDFTKTTKTRAGYGNFEDGLTIPGEPMGLGLWVFGNDNGHWLRARIVDAGGTEKLVDFAKSVDWSGWKHVKANFPADLKYPVKVTDIYLVETEGGNQDKGVLYFDELTLICPPTQADLSTKPPVELTDDVEVFPLEPATLEIGTGFKAVVKNPAGSADYLVTAQQVWDTTLPTPGFYPVMPLYRITAEANGDEMESLPGTMTISLNIREAKNINKVRLMLWDEKASAWTLLPSATNGSTATIKGKTNRLGLFGLMQDVRPAPVFSDTEWIWAKETIAQMADKRIVKGFPDGTFLPHKGVSRAEFITLIGNTLGWTSETTGVKFKDVIPAWAQGSIAAAVNRGIVKGYDDGTFKPNKVITRAEMAVILDKALNLPQSGRPSAYKDAKDIPAWAVQSIRNTKVAGVMKGSDNVFRPREVANRAEATAVMANILVYYLNS